MDEQGRAPRVPGYRVGRLLGRGGSATVWAGERERDGARVALKVLGGDDAPGRADEVAAELGALRHVRLEHVARLHEVCRTAAPEGSDTVGDAVGDAAPEPGTWGAPVLVLDRYDGGSVRDVLAARGHLSDGEAVTVLTPVAGALAGLHALGLVHGDVTPGNVLLDGTGRPVLADLGAARVTGDRSAARRGTDGFLAPEVEAGAPVTPAGDVHALGCLAWTCLAGAPPGPTLLRPPLAEAAPGAGAALVRVVEACLAADPDLRPDAATVASELFDAAPATALGLTASPRPDGAGSTPEADRAASDPVDPAAGLTRRIRAAAGSGLPAGLWEDPLAEDADATPPVRRRLRPGRAGRPVRGAVTAAVVGVLGLAVAAGAAVALRGLAPDPASDPTAKPAAGHRAATPGSAQAAGPSSPPRATSRGEATSQARATPAPTVRPVLRDPDAPRQRPRALVAALSAARARAWNATDPALLREVDAPGSPALAADRRALLAARAAGVRYRGVDLSVVSAVHVPTPGSAGAVRAVVDAGPYRVVRAGAPGQVVDAVSPRRGGAGVLDLVLTRDGWRVRRVRAG